MRLGSGVIVAVFLTLLLEPNTAVRAYWLQPVELRDIATDPQVVLPDGTGTVTGTSNPVIGQDSFLGIPFAQPPTENLRFAKPVALAANSSRMISATQFGYVCPQATSASLPWSYMSEDCLSVNILRPSNLPANASLPILVWIYGGGYSSGASSEYNGSAIVTQSMMRGQPLIYVSLNYRLNSFGWLSSSEIAGSTSSSAPATINPALYDMQLALQWIQNNIEAFGGNKDQVTVYGQSAGAISIGSLLLADGGQAVGKLNLFHGAIFESGAPQGDCVPPPSAGDGTYAILAAASGCPISANSSASTATLQCLRALPAEQLLAVTQTTLAHSPLSFPFDRAQDGYFHDRAPSASLSAGRVAYVSLIMGNVLDEGTEFVPTDVTDTQGIETFYTTTLPSTSHQAFLSSLNTALTLYPDNPAEGSPYDPVGVPTTDRFYGSTNQYKRLASLSGDVFFQSGRRATLQAYLSHDSSASIYSYLFATPTPGADAALGIYHASDIPFIYGEAALNSGLTSELGQTSLTMLNALIAFVSTFSPNAEDLPTWPKYGSNPGKLMLEIGAANVTIIEDTYREDQMNFLQSTTWTSPLYI